MTMLKSICAAVMLMAAPALAASNFDGTWKTDNTKTQLSTKPSTYLLKDGTYTCSACVPTLVVAADGKFHTVTGHPYFDEAAVTVVDAQTIELATRKNGRATGTSTRTVSADDKTATVTFNDTSAASGTPVTGTRTDIRVAKGPPGSHAVSGSWRSTPATNVSDSGLLVTTKLVGDTFSLTMPTGEAYTAKLGGPAAPVTGDPGWTSVVLKRTAPNTIVETDLYNDKPIAVITMTAAADGKSLKVEVDDRLRDKQSSYVAIKQ